MRRLIYLLFAAILLGCGTVNYPTLQGGTGHDDSNTIYPEPAQNASFLTTLNTFLGSEDAGRSTEYGYQNFVYVGQQSSACLGTTSAGLVMTPAACIAYNAGFRAANTPSGSTGFISSITFPNNSTTWVAMDENTTGSNAGLPNFSRVAGSHYLIDSTDATQPAMVSDSQILMKVVTSGGAITAVTDLRNTSAVTITTNQGTVDVSSFGALCNGKSTNNVVINGTSTITAALTTNFTGWSAANIGDTIRLDRANTAITLVTTVSSGTPNTATDLTMNDNADFTSSTATVKFISQGAEVTDTNCSVTAGLATLHCAAANFPIAAPAMSDGNNWAITVTGAKASSLTTTIASVTNPTTAVLNASPSLSKSGVVALWGHADGTAFVNAFTSLWTGVGAGTAVGHVTRPPGVCLIDKTIPIYGATIYTGPGAGGKYAQKISGANDVLSSALVSVIPTPAALTISTATESSFTATYTTSTAHGLETGEAVEISGVNVAGYNTPGTAVTVITTPSSTTFTATLLTSGLGAGAGGTAQPRIPMFEFSPYDVSAYPPVSTGPNYAAGIMDENLVGSGTDYPGSAILVNGAGAARFIMIDNVNIGSFPPAFNAAPASTDPDPVGQFLHGIDMVNADTSPMIISNSNIRSFRDWGVLADTNNSFTVHTMENTQIKPDNYYGAGGAYLNNEWAWTSNDIINTAGGVSIQLGDGGQLNATNTTDEAYGQLLKFVTNNASGHSANFHGGDFEICSPANAWDGVIMNSTVTGGSSVRFDGGAKFFGCVSGTLAYTGPTPKWTYKGGAGTHEQLILDGVQMYSAGLGIFTAASFDIVPTSNISSDVLFRLSSTSSNTDAKQYNVQNWLNSTGSTVDFTRYDLASQAATATIPNLSIAAGAPSGVNDVLAMGHSVGQAATAGLISYPNIIKGMVVGNATFGIAPGGYWRLDDASGNLADSSGNANTAVVAGAWVYSVASSITDDTDTAVTPNGTTGTATVATAASLPSGGTWTGCVAFKKATNGTLMTMIGQKTSGFQINSSIANLINVAQVGSGVVAATGSTAITDTNWHHVCASSTASLPTLVIDGVADTTQVAAATFAPADATLYLASNGAAGGFFSGSLDEMTVYTTALTVAQMQAVYKEWAAKKYGRVMYDTTIGCFSKYIVSGWVPQDCGTFTVAAKPTCDAAHKFGRGWVTDNNAACTATGFWVAPTGGGSTVCPVACDGTSWKVD